MSCLHQGPQARERGSKVGVSACLAQLFGNLAASSVSHLSRGEFQVLYIACRCVALFCWHVMHTLLKELNVYPPLYHYAYRSLTRFSRAQDVVQPPNIALPCGHVVCPEDFKQIGGKIEGRAEVRDDESVDEVENEEEFRREFMEHLRGSGVLPPGAGNILDALLGAHGEDDDEEDEGYDLGLDTDGFADSEEESHTSMPPLEQDSEDDDIGSDTSLPDLLPREDAAPSSDDDSDMPGLVNRVAGRDDDDSDSNSMPGLANRVAHANDSDEESMPGLIQRVEYIECSDDDDSMPGLLSRERSGAATVEPDTVDDMPRSASPPLQVKVARDHESGGSGVYLLTLGGRYPRVVWTNRDGSVPVIEADCSSIHLVPYADGYITMVQDAQAGIVEGYDCSSTTIFRYDVDADVQIASDGGSGIWTLGSCASAHNCKMLKYYNRQHRAGKYVRQLSSQSTLIRGMNEACWVHVKRESEHIPAGLWFFKAQGQKKVRSGDDISTDAAITPNADDSVWVMECSQRRTYLSRAGRFSSGSALSQRIEVQCDFTKDTKLITSTTGGVYVHTRKDGQWGLFIYKDNSLRNLMDCPRGSKVVADNHGNAWVLQRGISQSQRVLYKVNGQSETIERIPERHTAGTIMTGAF